MVVHQAAAHVGTGSEFASLTSKVFALGMSCGFLTGGVYRSVSCRLLREILEVETMAHMAMGTLRLSSGGPPHSVMAV